ncbi:hypothetical protein HPB52_003604 [Rhipicephalus sanguineus]|uniref:Uncharacterized protein n=1 Tax=Rhipicephalus sanguineus TaxID=34632 RepID=A0A9D4Q4K7_RHISA|nr:hypothetical protein HPB52_003604 [Rhipicephalus sanguineus]
MVTYTSSTSSTNRRKRRPTKPLSQLLQLLQLHHLFLAQHRLPHRRRHMMQLQRLGYLCRGMPQLDRLPHGHLRMTQPHRCPRHRQSIKQLHRLQHVRRHMTQPHRTHEQHLQAHRRYRGGGYKCPGRHLEEGAEPIPPDMRSGPS